jgi:hypothetical protein
VQVTTAKTGFKTRQVVVDVAFVNDEVRAGCVRIHTSSSKPPAQFSSSALISHKESIQEHIKKKYCVRPTAAKFEHLITVSLLFFFASIVWHGIPS